MALTGKPFKKMIEEAEHPKTARPSNNYMRLGRNNGAPSKKRRHMALEGTQNARLCSNYYQTATSLEQTASAEIIVANDHDVRQHASAHTIYQLEFLRILFSRQAVASPLATFNLHARLMVVY